MMMEKEVLQNKATLQKIMKKGLPQWVSLDKREKRRRGDTPTGNLVVLVEETSEDRTRIKGWTQEKAVDRSNGVRPWDFSEELVNRLNSRYGNEGAMQQCTDEWVLRWITLESKTVSYGYSVPPTPVITAIDNIQTHPMAALMQNFTRPLFYRARGDETVYYGDGGENNLVYPVWYSPQLPLAQNVRQQLVQELHELGDKRKDFQDNRVVLDIIDPDLCPRRLPSADWIALHIQQLQHEIATAGTDPFNSIVSSKSTELQKFEKNVAKGRYDDLSEAVKIRSTYQWIPAEFLVTADGKAHILSRIHNLPMENRNAYGYIREVFEGMVPMFRKLNLINNEQETRLQVIVKAQSYILDPLMTYSGRWHVEGHSENIAGVGVYYCHLGDGLEGGSLKFRPKTAPQPDYELNEDLEVEVQEGSAVVFANTIPHRFRMITNKSETKQRRTFLNFFILDPSFPLKSSATIPSSEFVCKVIIHYVSHYVHQHIPFAIVAYIISFIPELWSSTLQGKQFRKQAREAMKSEKSGWGWIHWGNAGTVEFVSSYSTWLPRRRDECDKLQHTDSDKNTDSAASESDMQ